jgi:hypothetical protein
MTHDIHHGPNGFFIHLSIRPHGQGIQTHIGESHNGPIRHWIDGTGGTHRQCRQGGIITAQFRRSNELQCTHKNYKVSIGYTKLGLAPFSWEFI